MTIGINGVSRRYRPAPGRWPTRRGLREASRPASWRAVLSARLVNPLMWVGSSQTARGTARGVTIATLPVPWSTRPISVSARMGSWRCSSTSFRRTASTECDRKGRSWASAMTHGVKAPDPAWSTPMTGRDWDSGATPAPMFKVRPRGSWSYR